MVKPHNARTAPSLSRLRLICARFIATQSSTPSSTQSEPRQSWSVVVIRSIPLFLLLATVAQAGIWPEQLGPSKRSAVSQPKLSDPKLWSEYGLQESETADYGAFRVTAYRLQDPTAALAAFYWQRGSATDKDMVVAHGNYLLRFEGHKPEAAELQQLYQQLPKLDESPLPALINYLPSEGQVSNSQRYITGPAGLEAFYPGIQSGMAAFHLGTEVVTGAFGAMRIAIFSFPTPNIARERLAEIQKIPGALVKRSGPLVAVILSPPSADDAERLLSQVRYQATITWSERMNTRKDNIGDLVINAFILIGILLGFSLVAGFAFGGLRLISRRGRKEDPDAMTVLHLGER
jgi:hypothetical protein